MVSPCYDTIDFVPLVVLLLSQISFTPVTLHILPEFTPNSRMLELHADKGAEPWEVFAWCVRDVISKKSGLPKEKNNNLQDKFAYVDFMTCQKDHMEVGGRMFRIGGTYDAKTFIKIS